MLSGSQIIIEMILIIFLGVENWAPIVPYHMPVSKALIKQGHLDRAEQQSSINPPTTLP